MEDFCKYDTILATRLDSEIIHKGFLFQTFTGRANLYPKSYFKNIYMILSDGTIKKFYGKKKLIKVYPCRIVLTEKNHQKLDFL